MGIYIDLKTNRAYSFGMGKWLPMLLAAHRKISLIYCPLLQMVKWRISCLSNCFKTFLALAKKECKSLMHCTAFLHSSHKWANTCFFFFHRNCTVETIERRRKKSFAVNSSRWFCTETFLSCKSINRLLVKRVKHKRRWENVCHEQKRERVSVME